MVSNHLTLLLTVYQEKGVGFLLHFPCVCRILLQDGAMKPAQP